MYIWEWFCELHSTRQYGFSANPISYQEIESFCRLTGAVIPPWELSAIRGMDAVVVSILNKAGEHKREVSPADVAETKHRIRSVTANRRVVKRERKSNGTGKARD